MYFRVAEASGGNYSHSASFKIKNLMIKKHRGGASASYVQKVDIFAT